MRKLTIKYNFKNEYYLHIDYGKDPSGDTVKVAMDIYVYPDCMNARIYVNEVKGLSFDYGVQNIQLSNLLEVLQRLETFMIESCPEVKAVMRDEEQEIELRKKEEQWLRSTKKDM
ncbi:MAG: hypothetical protein RBR14_06420 [Candidatus Cloacimonas acidaminovorans]|nr:hypothetical protein [Candidatus Cloacimonas acidaminovorans]